ncbi:uncharacterized protein LOC143236028 [Tachypleus tridentatus]|uniref:uncharacterized protein LOC143236028 n=1 Tax=Tachypleus tridentatus TaxID=6853 RepID=UPI003FCF87C6
MKLVKWMELHFGLSRRRSKKKQSQDPSAGKGQDYAACLTLANEIPSGFLDAKNIYSCPPSSRGCLTPQLPVKMDKKLINVRTSFVDLATLSDTSSPRQRSRIRTNPWLPSRGFGFSSVSSDSRSSSTSGSSDKYCDPRTKPSGPWSSLSSLLSGPSFSPLSAVRKVRLLKCNKSDENRPPHSPAFRPEKGSSLQQKVGPAMLGSRVNSNYSLENKYDTRHTFETTPSNTPEDPCDKRCFSYPDLDIDEAFSEDYQISENGDSALRLSLTVSSSSQADSACGSYSSTSPFSESAHDQLEEPDFGESLDEKVEWLKIQRRRMSAKITVARQEDNQRQEETVRLQQELLDYRILLLLRTLQGLRCRLEQQRGRLQRVYSATVEMKIRFAGKI